MRLLLDECVPARLRHALASREVSTVVREGWSGIKNGKLHGPRAIRFDVFVTVEKNLSSQQNTSNPALSVGCSMRRPTSCVTLASHERAGGGADPCQEKVAGSIRRG